ncbi:Hypothetical_protein [Hexamita inflata]|uniref:Hypothetical_protein n=1 Tax=Hexamita inflata TaxID=28002 RepID=A0ABP1KS37_9EUKA
MEIHSSIIQNLIAQRKEIQNSIDYIISKPITRQSSQCNELNCIEPTYASNSLLSKVFNELLSRPAQPLTFSCSVLDSIPINLQCLKIETLCSLIKAQCQQLCQLPNKQVIELRLCKNKYQEVKTLIYDLDNVLRSNILYFIQMLQKISKIPEYQINIQSLSTNIAVDIFQGFKIGDEKLLKFLIEFAFEFE